jgi:DNA-binding protein HU-beta
MTDMTAATAIAPPTAKPAAPKPTARKAISTKQLAYALAKKHKFTKKQGQEILKDLAGLITKHLKKRERVKITGLGSLQVRNRAARMGRNPATGEPIQIKASKKVAFRVTKELKMAI